MIDEIKEYFSGDGFIMYDGFDRAILGIEPNDNRVIYSYKMCIDLLVNEQDMSYLDALEFFDFNYVNAKSSNYDIPIICFDNF